MPLVDTRWIVHRDSRLVVLDKPSGLLAVPGRGPDLQDCLATRVQAAFPSARVVHRLDRDTSGLMLMALDAAAQRHLSGQFERREVRKTYTAIVHGSPQDDGGLVDLPIGRDPARPPRYRIDVVRGRPSLTRWRVLDRMPHRTRLVLEPLTGRSHQIRLHLATIGHPIVGDPLYADDTVGWIAGWPHPRLLLHATGLTLAHPEDCRPVTWMSPCRF